MKNHYRVVPGNYGVVLSKMRGSAWQQLADSFILYDGYMDMSTHTRYG